MGHEPGAGRGRRASPLLLAVLLAAGCANPVTPARDNYLDPDGTNFQNPGVEFLAGPSEGTTVTQDEVSFRWRGTGYAIQFNHRLDSRGWSEWSDADSARFRYLDDGPHQFMIYAQTGLGVVGGPWYRRFTADVAPSPGLIAVPWRTWTDRGSFFSITLLKKGVGPVNKARMTIMYPPALVLPQNVSPGSCWYPPVGMVRVADSSSPGVIDITCWLAPAGSVTSGNVLVQACFQALGVVTIDSIGIGPASCLITANGDTVAAPVRRGGIISISQ